MSNSEQYGEEWKWLARNPVSASKTVIIEKYEGERDLVSFINTGLITGAEGSKNLRVTSRNGNRSVEVHFKKVGHKVFGDVGREFKKIELAIVKLDSEKYHVSGWALEGVKLTLSNGTVIDMALTNLTPTASQLGLIGPSFWPIPACLLHAIVDEVDEGMVEAITNRVASTISAYGKFDYQPVFEVRIMSPMGELEENFRWQIGSSMAER